MIQFTSNRKTIYSKLFKNTVTAKLSNTLILFLNDLFLFGIKVKESRAKGNPYNYHTEGNYMYACEKQYTVKPVLSGYPKRRPNDVFQDQLSLNAGQKYCSMHSASLLTSIKLPFVIKIFILSIFEWPLKTGFTVYWD